MAFQTFDMIAVITSNCALFAIVDGKILPRDQATIPIWDAGFLHGKQIWSSPRLVNGKIFRLDDHLSKIQHGIRAMHCPVIPTNDDFIDAIRKVLVANKMQGATGVHIRIVFTPGSQVTASMNMKAVVNWDGSVIAKPRIIVMPEWRGMETNASQRQTASLVTPCRAILGELPY